MIKKRVKLVDIAEKLNVSVALVSVVLSGKWKANRISEKLALKVLRTAQEMGYQKNQLATSLRTGRTSIIGLVVADIGNPFFSKLARYIENEISKRGYQLMFASSDEDATKLERILEMFLSRQIDGLLVVPVNHDSVAISKIIKNDIPLVFIDRYYKKRGTTTVLTDNFDGAYRLCQILLNKGYRKVAAFVYDNNLTNNSERIRGYRTALKKKFNKEPEEDLVFEIAFRDINRSLKIALKQVLEKGCDAIFFANNHLGVLSLQYLRDLGVRIPENLGIVGFDNPEVFQFVTPSITCLEQPIKEISDRSVELLFEKIEGKKTKKEEQILLQGRIILRSSC